MRFWETVIEANLSFDEAYDYIDKFQKTSFITRPNWQGVHLVSGGKYFILTKEEEVKEVAIEEIKAQNQNDWLIVTINDKAVEILTSHNLI